MAHILVVCTGNICRSPAAAALLQHRLAQAGLGDWHVTSAGTWARDGQPATSHMVTLLADRGLDLSAHRARTVNHHILRAADLVLVMTRNHAEALRLEFPDQAHKIYVLSEMLGGEPYDIEDPFGGTLDDYRRCVAELDDTITNGLERIIHLAQKKERGD